MNPYRQGDLDSLCGLYCVINALRFAALPATKIGRAQSMALIQHLAKALGPEFGELFVDGTNSVKRLLRAADEWLQQTHGERLIVSRPFRRVVPPSAEVIAQTISTHLADPRTAVIACNLVHWSVVERVTPKRLVLFDSSLHQYMKFEGKGRSAKDNNIILPHKLLLLKVVTA